ncbi:hypothetical protein SUGI_0033110 [Cryptomeria japonica]|nr:hypothetical protein SUGI_0033110 [Cryptomeria japonica]
MWKSTLVDIVMISGGKNWVAYHVQSRKLIIGGNFNVIIDLSEKCGGSKKVTNDMLNFKSFVQKLEVLDYKPSEGWFTWTNRWLGLDNIIEHLDRFLIVSY